MKIETRGGNRVIVIPEILMEQYGWSPGDVLLVPFHLFRRSEERPGSISSNEELPDEEHSIPEELDGPLTGFLRSLSIQELKMVAMLQKAIEEFDDDRIRFENHREHYAIKFYGESRSKAWLVLRKTSQSISGIRIGLRVDEDDFKDPNRLAQRNRDVIAHGNRTVNWRDPDMLEDILSLVKQSYEFRKRPDFWEVFKEQDRKRKAGEETDAGIV